MPAYHEGQALRFDPASGTDWDALVSDDLRSVPIPTDDPSILERFLPLIDDFGSAEVRASVPVATVTDEGAHLFAGPSGVVPMQLDSAQVVARMGFNSARTRVVSRQVWGYLYGAPSEPELIGDDGLKDGGFVLRTKQHPQFDIRTTAYTADELLLGSGAVRQSPEGVYAGQGTPFWEIVTQYGFAVPGADGEWVFVQWRADREMFEIGCQYRYSLFWLEEAGASPTQVAWTAYGCDV